MTKSLKPHNLTSRKALDDRKPPNFPEFIERINKSLYYGGNCVNPTYHLSKPLSEFAAEIFSETHKNQSLHRLSRIDVGKMKAPACSLILSLIYLDRLKNGEGDPTLIRKLTPSELFLVSMMVSTKFYCGYDEDVYASAWAEKGNVSLERLKQLELEFLDAMNWNIYVTNGEFFEKLKSIERTLARRQGVARGWLTYTELSRLLPGLALIRQIISYSTVLALSYTAGVLSIALSFFVAAQVPGTALQCPKPTDVVSQQSRLGANDTNSVLPDSGSLESDAEAEAETELNYLMENLDVAVREFGNGSVGWVSKKPSLPPEMTCSSQCLRGPNIGINSGGYLKDYLDHNEATIGGGGLKERNKSDPFGLWTNRMFAESAKSPREVFQVLLTRFV